MYCPRGMMSLIRPFSFPAGTAGPAPSGRRAFTLVELLICIGIIALLMALLMPALTAMRAQANAVACRNHLRHITLALITYAHDNNGNFPPNKSATPAQWWYDRDRIGRYLKGVEFGPSGDARGRALTCPEDDDSFRSYAMNIWASCMTDLPPAAAQFGQPWKMGVRQPSRMMLVMERWSSTGSSKLGFTATATIGGIGYNAPPGRRFGAAGGVAPPISMGRFGLVNTEVPWYLHRPKGIRGTLTTPCGRVNIGYADGHVDIKAEYDVADPFTGLSRLEALWSPKDEAINQ
jgi:prepilin-type N-terminal cleavage/methylation domain-containing protein/prepilin-type processing-associated H-X9-DG protein